MKIRYLLRAAAAVGFFALSIPACTTQEPEFIQQPAEAAALLSNTQLLRWYEAQTGSIRTERTEPTESGATATAATPGLNWALATTTRVGAEHVTLVPFADPADLFAGSGYHGYRSLLLVQKARQQPKAAVVEVLATVQYPTATAQALFLDLYRKGKTNAVLPQTTFTGFVFFYTLRYEFRAGRGFAQGRVVPGNPQLFRSGGAANGKPGALAQRSNTCTYTIISHDPPYSVNVCDDSGGGSGGGGGGFGGGGSGGTGGNGPVPTDYPELPNGDGGGGGGDSGDGGGPILTFVPGMPLTMPKQLGVGGCVPASLTEVKFALCPGDQTRPQIEGAMFLYGIQRYGMNFPNDGVPLSGMNDFVDNFFTTTALLPAGNFQGAINSGYPIMIDVFAYMDGPNTQVYHNVVITGYNPNDPSVVYYLDPGTGLTQTGDAATLFASTHYAIPITGCK